MIYVYDEQGNPVNALKLLKWRVKDTKELHGQPMTSTGYLCILVGVRDDFSKHWYISLFRVDRWQEFTCYVIKLGWKLDWARELAITFCQRFPWLWNISIMEPKEEA